MIYLNITFLRFQFPSWTPIEEVGSGVDTVWRYQRFLSYDKWLFNQAIYVDKYKYFR